MGNSAYILLVLFVLIIGNLVFRAVKFGGLKAALFFGAPIEGTVGEVAGLGAQFGNAVVRVHRLGSGTPERAIGLEVVTKGFGNYRVRAVALSVSEAAQLASLLQIATNTR